LEKGLPEPIQLTLDGWTYIQIVDYEQLPFKCKSCHEYRHFTKNCPKAIQENPKNKALDQWHPAKRKRAMNKPGNRQHEQKETLGLPHQVKGNP
jgi:hypothetical protein